MFLPPLMQCPPRSVLRGCFQASSSLQIHTQHPEAGEMNSTYQITYNFQDGTHKSSNYKGLYLFLHPVQTAICTAARVVVEEHCTIFRVIPCDSMRNLQTGRLVSDEDLGESVGTPAGNVRLGGVEGNVIYRLVKLLAMWRDFLDARFTVKVPESDGAVMTWDENTKIFIFYEM